MSTWPRSSSWVTPALISMPRVIFMRSTIMLATISTPSTWMFSTVLITYLLPHTTTAVHLTLLSLKIGT
ncbi:unnamed protein product [Linum tenue]|uniref:Uncharacterized protein n=1 Tax=Linum tenue TaxID=586396 RepID=A0AAV0MJ71_9ROSI|nr:unnamed protein product [Linum tenue]CAI0445815.1 unnamed protein product [Linum tenue]